MNSSLVTTNEIEHQDEPDHHKRDVPIHESYGQAHDGRSVAEVARWQPHSSTSRMTLAQVARCAWGSSLIRKLKCSSISIAALSCSARLMLMLGSSESYVCQTSGSGFSPPSSAFFVRRRPARSRVSGAGHSPARARCFVAIKRRS